MPNDSPFNRSVRGARGRGPLEATASPAPCRTYARRLISPHGSPTDSRDRDRWIASEAAPLILDEVGLRTYLIAVELLDGEWIVRVDHPKDGAWREDVVRATHDARLATLDDRRRRAERARAWRPDLTQRDAA